MKTKQIKHLIIIQLMVISYGCKFNQGNSGIVKADFGSVKLQLPQVEKVTVSAYIDSDGGKISSADGRFTAIFGKGNLDRRSKVVVMQKPSENTACIGPSYHLDLEGTKLQGNYQIRFCYGGLPYTLSPAFVKLAYKTKGGWKTAEKGNNDQLKKEISIRTSANGDWAPVEWLRLEKSISKPTSSKPAGFRLVRFTAVPGSDIPGEFIPNPSLYLSYQHPQDLKLSAKPTALDSRYIGKWSISGGGMLERAGNFALYSPAAQGSTRETGFNLSLNLTHNQTHAIAYSIPFK